jgi:hypothetical protein
MKNNNNNYNTNTMINEIYHLLQYVIIQKKFDFYTKLFWLRLVKLTVNFDDPTT